MNQDGYADLRGRVLTLTGIDLDSYKGPQLERRLAVMMRRAGADTLLQYAEMLSHSLQRLQEFRDFLMINVTEFFRDPGRWEELQQRFLPALLRRRSRLRIWSAGCSTGAEPYSLAILLDELSAGASHRILASDLDGEALAAARRGVYLEPDLREVNARRRARYFTRQGDRWMLRPEIRARVRFIQHNLLCDPFPGPWDLILCRNVVIYFTQTAKQALYQRFHAALRPEGILFVGGTESLVRGRELGLACIAPALYQKGAPAHSGADERQVDGGEAGVCPSIRHGSPAGAAD